MGLGDYAPDLSQVETAGARALLAVVLTIMLSAGLALFGIVIGSISKLLNSQDGKTKPRVAQTSPPSGMDVHSIEVQSEETNPASINLDRRSRSQILTGGSKKAPM